MAHPRVRITKRLIDGIKPEESDFYVFDTDVTGFGIRVRATGGISYIVQYKGGIGRGAPTRRVTLGAVGKMPPELARKAAERVLGSVAHGEDPAADKKRERRALPLANVIDAFLKDHVEAKRKAGTAAGYRDLLERLVKPALGQMKPDKVTRQDVSRLHLSLQGTPSQANKCVGVISSLYSFAGENGYAPEGCNPAQSIKKFPEKRRERFLTSEELARFGKALRLGEAVGLPWHVDESNPKAKHAPKEANRYTVLDPYAAAAIRLLILTGARLREILHVKWENIDFDRGIIHLPDSKTGRRPIYLSSTAQTILSGLPRVEGNAFVFIGNKAGKPRTDLKKPWTAVTKAAALEGLRIHDLRHSFASIGVSASMGLPIVGKLLGHTQPSTTARYAHLDADPMKRAVEQIGTTITAAMARDGKQKQFGQP